MNGNIEVFDRPGSEQLIDLHIYIVPTDLWRAHLQSAIHQVVEETVSAGFIRVHPELPIHQLRLELVEQLEYDSNDYPIPNEYVFLKCVGRCLTQVKQKQEYSLKVKHFQPPSAYASEIFILDAEVAGSKRQTPYSGGSSRYGGTPRSDRSEFTGHKPIPPINNGSALSEDEQRKLDDLLRRQKGQEQEMADQAEAERRRKAWEEEQERRRQQEEEERRKRPEEEEERRRAEEERRRKEDEENKRRRNSQEDENERRKREEEEERRRREEEGRRSKAEEDERDEDERRRNEEEERRRREEEIRNKEEERRKEEEERRRKEEEERRRKEEEERRRKEEEERRGDQDSHNGSGTLTPGSRSYSDLQDELEQLRQERQNAERNREELVKRARLLQNKTQQRRNHARDAWKKKYFEEKKKTNPLDEQCNKLRSELDLLHRKIMSQLESSKDIAKRPGDSNKPSQQSPSNLKIQATRLNHDIEELQRRVENVKMKLTTEMKLRNQAQGELKALRAELTQKKIHQSLGKGYGVNHPTSHTPGPGITPRS